MSPTGYDATRAVLDEVAGWKPARPGDTPGEMVPGDDPFTTGEITGDEKPCRPIPYGDDYAD